MASSILEADAKCLLWYSRSYEGWVSDCRKGGVSAASEENRDGGSESIVQKGVCARVSKGTHLQDLPQTFPWLLQHPLVVKPDVLLKRRGKCNLVRLKLSWEEAVPYIESVLCTKFSVDGLTGPLDCFILEPFYDHAKSNEFYVAIRTLSEGDEILFLERGGIDVGAVESKAHRLLIPVSTEETTDPSAPCRVMDGMQSQIEELVNGVEDDAARSALPEFLKWLYSRFCALHFAFLEINPFCFDAQTGKFIVIDAAAKIDRTADFLCPAQWEGLSVPNPFGRALTEEEMYIRELDHKTGASLKLTILNPKGRIWTMIAGGGASVVYTDTICDLGFASELCNYGEYSGAPSEVTTYEYARTILSLVTAPGTYREEGKVLLIGGGIANFTSVADTFKGIIRALRHFASKLIEFKVSIYVRRGGPSYQDGLRLMREVGEELGLDMNVFGPETYITAIIPLALEGGKKSGAAKNGCANGGGGALLSNFSNAGELPCQESWPCAHPTASCTSSGGEDGSKILTGCPSLMSETSLQHVQSWEEVSIAEVEKDPIFEKCVERLRKHIEEHKSSTPAVRAPSEASWSLFTPETRCVVWGLQARAVQEMLDFDHVCGRKTPSVAAIVYEFSPSHLRPFYFGTEEVFIPVCQSLKEAVAACPQVDVLINFASMRSAASVCSQTFAFPNFKTIAVIAEGVPERLARALAKTAKERCVTLIGPATVGGMRPGCFRIGNTGGSLENIMNAKLFRPGCVGFVTKSGGMLNELNNILSVVSDGTCEGIAIGGDRFPGTSMLEHLLRFEQNPDVKILMLLGEVGGTVEYEVAEALQAGRIRKPLIAWCVGTCAPLFSTEVAFGHAGAWAGSYEEHASAKNRALREAGAFVPTSFQSLGAMIGSVFKQLLKQGFIQPRAELPAPRVPLDYAWAKKLGLVRRPKGFVSTISDDRGEELLYAGWPISKVLQEGIGVGGVLSLLWFKRPLAPYCYKYLETVLMLTADHGPAVCGAHNVIVTSRAGKDLISSLISGLCTIGDRFGGACDQAAQQFLNAYTRKLTPEEFVKDMKAQNQLIMGIGHRVKSVHNPDRRVQLLKEFCLANFSETPLIQYALEVEKVTTKKKDTLILNVDGLIGVSMCDMLFHCGFFNDSEARDYIENGCINGLFVLGRSIGFIGHYLDQKRLKQGLYRHDVDDISYVLPDLQR